MRSIAAAPDRRFQPKTEWSIALAVEASELGDPHHSKDEASLINEKRTGFVARSASDPFAAASSQNAALARAN